MRRYFKGEIGVLTDLPVATTGTPFQNSVWQALRKIKDGTTICYAELARRIGKPKAVRAAGPGQRPEPDQHRRALPSRDRLERQPDRLRRRAGTQAMAARA